MPVSDVQSIASQVPAMSMEKAALITMTKSHTTIGGDGDLLFCGELSAWRAAPTASLLSQMSSRMFLRSCVRARIGKPGIFSSAGML